MTDHDATQEVPKALNFVTTYGLLHASLKQVSATSPLVEYQLVLCQCACLITEQVVNLSKIFVQGHALRLTVQLSTGFIYIHHLLIVVHEHDVENLYHFKTYKKLHGHKLVEKQVEREERITRHFIDIVSALVEYILCLILVLCYVLVVEKSTNSCHNDDHKHVEEH